MAPIRKGSCARYAVHRGYMRSDKSVPLGHATMGQVLASLAWNLSRSVGLSSSSAFWTL
jgi:hypothetical protein